MHSRTTQRDLGTERTGAEGGEQVDAAGEGAEVEGGGEAMEVRGGRVGCVRGYACESAGSQGVSEQGRWACECLGASAVQ